MSDLAIHFLQRLYGAALQSPEPSSAIDQWRDGILKELEPKAITTLSSGLALLACPCCGGPAAFVRVPNSTDEKDNDPNAGGEFIECTACQLSTFIMFPLKESVKRQLAERWNKRTQPPAADPAGELLLEARETACGNAWEFNDGGPKQNKAKFCMFCGGKLIVPPTLNRALPRANR